jgi:hypothetical protein
MTITNKNLEKRCVNKTFPNLITIEEEKCKNPLCNGYDKLCPQYVPTGNFSLSEIEMRLNHQDHINQIYKGGNTL